MRSHDCEPGINSLLECEGMLGALLENACDNENAALSVKGPGADISWSFSTIHRHVSAVAAALKACLGTRVPQRSPSGAFPDQSADRGSPRHVVVCGSTAFQAIMATACYRQGYVGVFVPTNEEETLSCISVVQRACEAFAIVVDDNTWSSLSLEIQSRCDIAWQSADVMGLLLPSL